MTLIRKLKIKNKDEYLLGCQLKHSRVDKCMSKEQVAFKFHECPDGDEEDSRGSVTDIFIKNSLVYITIFDEILLVEPFASCFRYFISDLMIGTMMENNIEDGGKI